MKPTRLLALSAGLAVLSTLGSGATLSYYEESLPTTMNPLFARSMVDRRSHELVFDRMYYRSAVTSEIKSRIVERENRLDGGLALEVFLRDGVKWHDGQPLTVEDVCFTVDVLLNPDTPSQMAKPHREHLQGCEVGKDRATIRFTKKFYNPTERLSFAVLPKHVFGGNTTISPDHEFSLRPTGTGPMKGSKGRREVKFSAVANAHHSAAIDVVSMAEGGDPLVQVRTLMNGGVNGLVSVSPALRPDVAATDDVALKSYDLRSWWFIAMNTNKKKLLDRRVRKAVSKTLDRFELRRLTMGYDPDDVVQPCQFISGPFIPQSPYYNRGVRVDERADMAAASELMTEAGATQEHGMWILDGEPVTLQIGMAAPLDLEARDLLNQIGNQLQSGGFGRQVFKVSNDDWNNKAITGQLKEDYDLLIGKWSFGVVENVSPLFETRSGGKGSLNIFDYSSNEVDKLVSDWEMARTDTEAQDAYHELHRWLDKDLPYIFLWKLDTKSAWRLEVRGNTITPYWYFTEFDNWTFRG